MLGIPEDTLILVLPEVYAKWISLALFSETAVAAIAQ